VTPHILRDTERFADYHKLTWEKKLLGDDLFGQDMKLRAGRFAGPDVPQSAQNRLRLLEDSGELDAGVLKSPLTDEQKMKLAEDTLKQREKHDAPPQPKSEDEQKK
jgi:hypothetical protein